jgi:hypothetical protein
MEDFVRIIWKIYRSNYFVILIDILDTARLFPPSAPRNGKSTKLRYLYELLRPEFVSNKEWNKVPLSSVNNLHFHG